MAMNSFLNIASSLDSIAEYIAMQCKELPNTRNTCIIFLCKIKMSTVDFKFMKQEVEHEG